MHPLVPAQRVDHAHQPDGRHGGGQHLDPLQRQRHRHPVVDAQPAYRQQLAVADRQVQLDRLADEGAPLAEVAPVVQRAQRQPVPRPGHRRHQRQQPGDQYQTALAEDQPGHKEDDGDRDPGVAELRLLAGVDDQPAAQAALAGDGLRRGHAAAHHGGDDGRRGSGGGNTFFLVGHGWKGAPGSFGILWRHLNTESRRRKETRGDGSNSKYDLRAVGMVL